MLQLRRGIRLFDILTRVALVIDVPWYPALVERDRFRARRGQLESIGNPGLVIAPPDRRPNLRL